MIKLFIFLCLGLIVGTIDTNTGGGFLLGGAMSYLITKDI